MSESRQDDLENLIHSDGWLLFREEARKQWGPEGYGRKVAQVIAANSGTAALAQAVEIVHAAAQEVNALMKWPDDELKKLQPVKAPEYSMHRGGR